MDEAMRDEAAAEHVTSIATLAGSAWRGRTDP
jgi:hypothetical protein